MDKEYWAKYYNSNPKNENPSQFCTFVKDYFKSTDVLRVLDSGCGNGRDTYSLAERYVVDGVDNCGNVPKNAQNANFFEGDFVELAKDKYDLVYSRFSFHSITNAQQEVFLDSIMPNTYVALETRSLKGIDDDLHHGKTHFRNWTDLDYLKGLLTQKAFNILFIKEGIDMAIYKDENPICIRVIAQKNAN